MFKNASAPTDSSPSPTSRGTTTRASDARDDTAQPPLTSGFGSIMEREQHIRSSTNAELGRDNGPKSSAIDRTLREQQKLLDANLALLAQRYEMLPHPTRFAALEAAPDRVPTAETGAEAQDPAWWLSSLVSQHLNLRRAIDGLIARRPDGRRGELILAEIARNHELMASRLTALIKVDVVQAPVQLPGGASRGITLERGGIANWENEGGAQRGQ